MSRNFLITIALLSFSLLYITMVWMLGSMIFDIFSLPKLQWTDTALFLLLYNTINFRIFGISEFYKDHNVEEK